MRTEHPRLRPVEAFPVRHGDQDLICLRDPFGYNDQVVALSSGVLPILRCLDGQHSLRDIQTKIARRSSEIVSLEALERFVADLDQALLLDSPHFEKARDRILQEYRDAPYRPAAYAGQSYPATATEITEAFDRHFEPPRGPGRGAAPASRAPAAIIAPHIDLRRGGPAFAWAYGGLRGVPRPDLYVVLGVAHVPTQNRYVATRQDFATPLGRARTDQAFLDRLADRLPFDLFADELVHRTEHSVEFQVVYLQHVLADTVPCRIVPVLVGSFHDLLESGREPIADQQVAAFAAALRETIAATDQQVCVVAGVDLAHVGGRFGDGFTINAEVLAQLAADDRAMLGHVEAADPVRFGQFIYQEQDRRRVDGFPGVYTLLQALQPQRGALLCYDQSFEEDTNSVVTFASLHLW
ncbi:AmmeMemoRadiSam system protein B [bacterium]|nr:AmmeMemoRadiSam system protein B [bacterium]